MPREVERKFLVEDDSWRDEAREAKRIRQAYLARTKAAQVRVRIVDDLGATLTIKSADPVKARAEFEYEVPAGEAGAMLDLAETRVLEKTRHVVPAGEGREWEIDVFEGALAGLVLAEIELGEEGGEIALPGWCGREVTGDPAYYNATLAGADGPPDRD